MKVFISHSSKDKKFVRTLKDGLIENSIDTWFDEDQLDLGDSLVTKLENALDNSSHLVLILSPHSVSSEWVSFELKKALANQRTGLLNKIIPIKYKNCEIPTELGDLLYADLSDEVVLPTDDNRIKFISDGYDSFFLKLVRAIRNSTKALSEPEKKEIIKSIKSSEKDIAKHIKTIHRGNYKLIGYNTLSSRVKYQKIIAKKLQNTEYEKYKPFLLPSSLKNIFKLKIGDEIEIDYEVPFGTNGHFAGYRTDDLAIAVDKRIRDAENIKYNKYYQIEFDPENKKIHFVSEIKN